MRNSRNYFGKFKKADLVLIVVDLCKKKWARERDFKQ